MENYYIAFDSLIKERNEVLDYMIDHQIEIMNHVKKAKCYELYSSLADDLGILTPCLIRDKITSGYHKGNLPYHVEVLSLYISILPTYINLNIEKEKYGDI